MEVNMLNFLVDEEKCTKCGDCIKDCPVGIIAFSPEYPDIIEVKKRNASIANTVLQFVNPGH